MKKVLIFPFLLFSLSGNSQIEQYIQSCKDTSKIYARQMEYVPKSVEYIPTSNFYFEVIEEINANGSMVYSISDSRFQNLLDSTRISAGVGLLERNPKLDIIAEERAIRMVNLLIGTNSEPTTRDGYSGLSKIFSREAHKGGIRQWENALFAPYRLGRADIFSYPIGNYDCPEASLATFYTRLIRNDIDGLDNLKFDINSTWNKSPGHYANRINEKHKEFGYSIIVVNYTENNKGKFLIIAYEVFDTEILTNYND